MIDYDFCLSSYLTFRYVVKPGVGWKKGFIPHFPLVEEGQQHTVKTSDQILAKLRKLLEQTCKGKRVGVLLSGGIDSAILAALMPEDTLTYTIKFIAPNAIDESRASPSISTLKVLRKSF